MNKINWKQKLSSRKLWACILGVAMGAGMAFGLDESTASTVAGAVTSLASIIGYILAEGKIDAARAGQAVVDAEIITEAVREAWASDYKVGGSE